MIDPTERRRRISAGEVAQSLAMHEAECARQSAALLNEIREFWREVAPILEIWNAGGVGVKLAKLIMLLAGTIAAVAAAWTVFRLRAA